jgi:hypothetical protein
VAEVQNRACLDEAPHPATLVNDVDCLPPSYNDTIDDWMDLPGPLAVSLPGTVQLLP